MESMSFLKIERSELTEIISLYIPMFAEQLMVTGVGTVITSVTKASGMEAVAAVTLLNSLVQLFQQSFISLGVGASVVVAQLRGRGDSRTTGRAASQAVTLALMTSVTVSVLCYLFSESMLAAVFRDSEPLVYEHGRLYLTYNILSLPLVAIFSMASASIRGSGHPRITLFATLAHNGAYITMALVSVRALGFGLKGISASLMISRFIAAAIGLALLRRGNDHMRWSPLSLKIDRGVAKPIFRVAIPLLMENLMFSGGRLITQSFSVSYGTNSIAANGIANNISGLMMTPGSAFSNVAPPLVGRYCGKGDLEGAKRKGYQLTALAALMATLSSVVTAVILKPLTGSMTDSPDVRNQVYTVVISYCIMMPIFWPFSFVTPSILRSSGDGKFTSAVCISAMLLARITTGYILAIVFRVGIIGIWLSMYLDWFMRTAFFIPRFRSGKWLRQKVLD